MAVRQSRTVSRSPVSCYKMKRILSFLIYVFLSATAADDSMKRNEKCTNPYNRNGTCVALDDCPEIYDVSTSKYGIDLLFATESYCGTDEEVLVCCEQPGPVEITDADINSLLGNRECGIVKEQPRIYGGERAEIGEFPWLVGINYENAGDNSDAGLRCGGSLINNEYVLTVAHCLYASGLQPNFVRLGEWDTSTDPDCVELVANKFCADPMKIVGIKETIPHPFYSKRTGYNNIGLIRLEEKVTFTDFIAPICLPSPNMPLPEANEKLVVAGWGSTENAPFSQILLKVTITVVSDDECRRHQRRGVDRHAFCAGGESGKDSCQGDSGGPLMKSYANEGNGLVWYVHGLPSYAVVCGREGYPGVHVNISHYIGWILKTVAAYSKVGL